MYRVARVGMPCSKLKKKYKVQGDIMPPVGSNVLQYLNVVSENLKFKRSAHIVRRDQSLKFWAKMWAVDLACQFGKWNLQIFKIS